MSKPSLLVWEQEIDNRFNTSVDQSFEDLVRDTEQRDGAIALWVLYRLLLLNELLKWLLIYSRWFTTTSLKQSRLEKPS